MFTDGQIGQLVKRQRLELKLTQKALATRAGIEQCWLSRIESGHRKVALSTLLKLCRALNLTANDLLGMKNTKHKPKRK